MMIFMTMDGVASSIICANGTVRGVAQLSPAADVITGYFADKPIPAHQNGV